MLYNDVFALVDTKLSISHTRLLHHIRELVPSIHKNTSFKEIIRLYSHTFIVDLARVCGLTIVTTEELFLDICNVQEVRESFQHDTDLSWAWYDDVTTVGNCVSNCVENNIEIRKDHDTDNSVTESKTDQRDTTKNTMVSNKILHMISITIGILNTSLIWYAIHQYRRI